MLNYKVYTNGEHFIAMRRTPGRAGVHRPAPPESPIIVEDKPCGIMPQGISASDEISEEAADTAACDTSVNEIDRTVCLDEYEIPQNIRISTRGKEFKRLYAQTVGMKWMRRRDYIASNLSPYFSDRVELYRYVDYKMRCACRASAVKRTRCIRRAAMHGLNLFCTFTYDSKKMDEETFRRKLLNTLRHFANRKGWKYMGTWERGEKNDRLHFHALLRIPDGMMSGEIVKRREYDVHKKRMVEYNTNTFFEKAFGRNTFDVVDGIALRYTTAVSYIVKYLEKSGGRITCSRGLNTFIETNIDPEDIIVRLYDFDDRKYILFDDFKVFIGEKCLGSFSRDMLSSLKMTG